VRLAWRRLGQGLLRLDRESLPGSKHSRLDTQLGSGDLEAAGWVVGLNVIGCFVERAIVNGSDRSCAEQLGGYGCLPGVHPGRQGAGRLA
jgi:hypothetical protein